MNILSAIASAASPTSSDKLRQIPMEFWLKIGLGILVIVIAVIVLRKIAKVNKVVLAVGVALGASIVGFNWIYERNEPAWAEPTVQWLAGFFPSKGKVQKTHH